MNHQQIDQFDLIDRYLMGKLLGEERTSFEAHFVDCPQCIAHLQTAKNFLEDLRGMTAQAWRIEPLPRAQPFGSVLQARRSLVLAIGALLLAAILGALFVANHTERLRAEADLARQLAAQWEQRYEDERQAAMVADARRQQAGPPQAAPPRAPEVELKTAAGRHEKPAGEPSRRMAVGGNLPVVALKSLRGEPAAAEPVNQITVPRAAPFFVLSVVLEESTPYQTYRGTVRDSRGRRVWGGRLKPDSLDVLFAWFKSERFRPGSYSFTVEGDKPAGGRQVIGKYPFVLNKTP
jgi:hypothetical protein